MTDGTISEQWSKRFGLARSPMFGCEQNAVEGEHDVLLDGGYGSFGLSIVSELSPPLAAAGWAWSSDLPHHVSITRKEVQVVRWDDLDVLRAYTTLLNSRTFMRLVSFRSVTIAGGQFDLSSRFLAPVHLPDLWEKAQDPFYAEHVRRLALVSRVAEGGRAASYADVDQLVAHLYGVPELAEG